MSLYNHVANKDDILDGMVDLVRRRDRLAAGRGRLERGHAPEGHIRPAASSPSTPGRAH